MSKQQYTYVNLSAGEILHLIRNKEARVYDVVNEHIECIEAKKNLNAVIYPLFDEAREQAKRTDAKIKEGHTQGSLLGLPMTIKDQYKIHGTPTSCGLSHRSKTIINDEGSLIPRLRKEGAIFLGKTNLPQLLVSYESHHSLHGSAKNPWHTKRTPGGSSGGEAAAIASGCSPLGLGCDMGGSIRVPAHCCGITGLKPTTGRFPNDDTPFAEGYFSDFYGFEGFLAQPGPMARSVDDLKLCMDALLKKPLLNSLLAPPVQWELGPIKNHKDKNYRIGFFSDNGFFSPSPALKRVTNEASAALNTSGLSVKEFTPPNIGHGMEIGMRLLGSDGGRWIKKALQGETPIADIQALIKITGIPNFLRYPLAALLRLTKQHHAARSLTNLRPCSANEYWHFCAKRTLYSISFLKAMDEQDVDILICPPYGLPAPIIDNNKYGTEILAASYSSIFNITGMPAGVVPAGFVKSDEESNRPHSKDKTEQEAAFTEKDSTGMPVGIQVVGRHWCEQDVLAIMKALETHFNYL